MTRGLTNRSRRGRLLTSSENRGGRAGNRPRSNERLICNIPSHISGERIVPNATGLQDEQLEENVRLGRMLQGQRRTGLNFRERTSIALGAAALKLATDALLRARASEGFRGQKSPLPLRPEMVGSPGSRKAPRGSRRGQKGGAFRFPRLGDFPRRRRSGRKRRRNLHIGPRSGGFTGFITEEGL